MRKIRTFVETEEEQQVFEDTSLSRQIGKAEFTVTMWEKMDKQTNWLVNQVDLKNLT